MRRLVGLVQGWSRPPGFSRFTSCRQATRPLRWWLQSSAGAPCRVYICRSSRRLIKTRYQRRNECRTPRERRSAAAERTTGVVLHGLIVGVRRWQVSLFLFCNLHPFSAFLSWNRAIAFRHDSLNFVRTSEILITSTRFEPKLLSYRMEN